MVHRPWRLPEIFEEMRRKKIEPKRMRMVSPSMYKEHNMVLTEGRKGGKRRLSCEKPLIINGEDGKYTEEITEVYGY